MKLRKIPAVLCAAWLSLFCCGAEAAATGSAETVSVLRGDVDSDGEITVKDAQLTLLAYAELLACNPSGLDEMQTQAADVDRSGGITAEDSQSILNYYAFGLVGLVFPWEQVITGTTDLPLTPVDADGELFGAYYIKATRRLAEMTTEEKVSQMFLAGYPGYTSASAEVKTAKCPAGYVLFADDFRYQTPASLSKELKALKANSEYGLLLGGDEEGGGVVRASMFKAFRASKFPSPQTLFKQGGMAAVMADAEEKAVFLQNIELNYNLAPVADMPKSASSYIYGRSLGQNAETTAEFTAGVVEIMNSHGMLSTLKHFPGYGDNLDTHSLVSVDKRTKEQFEQEDFLPFISGIEAGAPMIMVNHNIINCMDSKKPASLSEEVHRVLREELHFTGIIMTDALNMGAVQQYTTDGEAAVQAVLCGNDMIATTAYAAERKEVLNAVQSGRIPEVMVNDAVRRILACKYAYGLLT